jgi:hypothetical protein
VLVVVLGRCQTSKWEIEDEDDDEDEEESEDERTGVKAPCHDPVPILPARIELQLSRFKALNTAFTEASSMLVSTPAPQRVLPSLCLT